MSVTFSEIHGGETLSRAARVRSSALSERLVRIGIGGVLIVSPFWFGAASLTAGIILAAVCWLLFLVWLVKAIREGELPLSTHPVLLPAGLLLAFSAIHWATGISASVPATQLEWLRWLSYLAIAWAAGESFVTPHRLRRLAATLAVAGVAIAVLGIAQHLTANGQIYWAIDPSQGGWVFGPYVNRNHFAGLMELWIPVAMGLALVPDISLKQRWLWCAAALVMASAVVLSASRAGLLIVGVEIAVLFAATVSLRGKKRAITGLVVSLAAVAAMVWYAGSPQVLDRFAPVAEPGKFDAGEVAGHRLDAWRGSLQIFGQNWLLGTGLDTFEPHFRPLRPYYTDKVWTHAHNDFLQLIAETGLVGLGLGMWLVIAAIREIFRNLQRTEHTATGAILIGFACGCLGFMLHGWLDFNFHIPANAVNFVVLGAIVARRGWDED